MKAIRQTTTAGLTMVEVMITIGLVAVLCSISMLIVGKTKGRVELAKFEQDVTAVNSAAKLFVYNGGSFDGLSDAQEILDRMKSAHTHAARQQFVGISGAMIDKRLVAKSVTGDQADYAAVWDAATKQFVIQKDAQNGIARFDLDESLAEVEFAAHTGNASIMEYDDKPGWVWKYEEKPPTFAEGPTVFPTSETPDTAPPPQPVLLIVPRIVLSSLAFSNSTPEITVTINNPNASSSSTIVYSIVPAGDAHGPASTWGVYGGPLPTQSASYPDGFEVVAYAKSIDAAFLDSGTAAATTTTDFFGSPTVGNVLFVVDASSSMGDSFGSMTRFDATIIELVSAIRGLPGNIKFNVALFDQGIHWTDGTFKLHPANLLFKDRLISQVEKLSYDRGTNYSAALSLPTMYNPIPDQVILLSDGEPNNNSFLNELAKLVELGVRVDTIGLNSSGNGRAVLQLIADETGGKINLVN